MAEIDDLLYVMNSTLNGKTVLIRSKNPDTIGILDNKNQMPMNTEHRCKSWTQSSALDSDPFHQWME